MMRYTIMGCGSSGGVPRIGNDWGACDPTNPKNRRTRCSLLVERIEGDAITRVLIDTSPDMREQLLRQDIATLDGVIYTHEHADHMNGLDDLRVISFNRRSRLPVWADGRTTDNLLSRFGYAFVQPAGSDYPPILDLHAIDGPVEIDGAAGPIRFDPFEVKHGRIDVLGFRIGDLAYLPDVEKIYDLAWPTLENLKVWVVDALRYKPHGSHTHLAQTLEWIERMKPEQAVITNMHIDLDFDTLNAETPANVTAAFDGMRIEIT